MNTINPQVAAQVRPLARQWVNQTFFGTLLKQARQSPLSEGAHMFTGGRGGNAFGSLLDQHLSEGAGGGSAEKLVDALVNQIAARR